MADLHADLTFDSRRPVTAPWWSAGAERVVVELFEGQLLANGWVTGGEQAAGWQGALYEGK